MAENILFDEKDPKNQSIFSIQPKDLLEDKDSGFYMAIALICNDISDLTFLHDLHEENFKHLSEEKYIYPHQANVIGRKIYLSRHAASLAFSVSEFVNCRKDIFLEISKKGLSNHASDNLKFILDLSKSIEKPDQYVPDESADDGIEGMLEKTRRLLKLMYNSRNRLTYHHMNAQKFLKLGVQSFCDNNKISEVKDMRLFVNQSSNIDLNRNYYIDIAVQSYLAKSVGIKIGQLPKYTEALIVYIAMVDSVFQEILKDHYKKMIIPIGSTLPPPKLS